MKIEENIKSVPLGVINRIRASHGCAPWALPSMRAPVIGR